MPRASVAVRDACDDDLPALVALWGELREQGLRRFDRPKSAEVPETIAARFRAAMAHPAYRLVVAEDAGEIAGMALLRLLPSSPLYDLDAIELSNVCVGRGHRRRGAGKALLAAAAAFAEEHGRENVAVSVLPQDRDAHRIYARMGFAPVSVRRIAPVGVLRRRLGLGENRLAVLHRDLPVPRRAALARTRRRRAAEVTVPDE